MTKKGERVGAILSANDKTVKFLGYGVYEGDFYPDTAEGSVADMIKDNQQQYGIDLVNPRLKLDNGDIVWGCECWWGAEESVKKSIGNREIVTIKISEARKLGGKS